jgi:hypothetical protein
LVLALLARAKHFSQRDDGPTLAFPLVEMVMIEWPIIQDCD